MVSFTVLAKQQGRDNVSRMNVTLLYTTTVWVARLKTWPCASVSCSLAIESTSYITYRNPYPRHRERVRLCIVERGRYESTNLGKERKTVSVAGCRGGASYSSIHGLDACYPMHRDQREGP